MRERDLASARVDRVPPSIAYHQVGFPFIFYFFNRAFLNYACIVLFVFFSFFLSSCCSFGFSYILWCVSLAMMWTHGSRSVLVTCGSVIKLRHESTGYHLHSHTIKWGGGSGQQSVTAHGSEDDQGSMWLVSLNPNGTHIGDSSSGRQQMAA